MALTQRDLAWLDRAQSIFETPASHLQRCVANGGSEVDPVHLNPGFVGRRCPETGGVLCLGLANGVTDPRFPWHGRARRELARTWISAPRSPQSDEAFFRGWQADFVAEVADTWRYWRQRFGPVLEPLDLEPDDVAHANLAPCRMMYAGGGERLARLCTDQHRVAELIDLLSPAVVVVASVLGEPARGLLRWGRHEPSVLIAYDGRNFKRSDGRRKSEWVEVEVARARRALQSSAAAVAVCAE